MSEEEKHNNHKKAELHVTWPKFHFLPHQEVKHLQLSLEYLKLVQNAVLRQGQCHLGRFGLDFSLFPVAASCS